MVQRVSMRARKTISAPCRAGPWGPLLGACEEAVDAPCVHRAGAEMPIRDRHSRVRVSRAMASHRMLRGGGGFA